MTYSEKDYLDIQSGFNCGNKKPRMDQRQYNALRVRRGKIIKG